MSQIKGWIRDCRGNHLLVRRIGAALDLAKLGDSFGIVEIGRRSCDQLIRLSIDAVLEPIALPIRHESLERVFVKHSI